MRAPVLIFLAFSACAAAPGAHAASLVLGGGQAKSCYDAARAVESRGPANAFQLADCDRALETEALSVRDRAGTFVNRGILRMSRQEYAAALADYSEAVRIQPESGVAHVNRGAALIALDRPEEGVAAIDQGLANGSDQPEKAYFNRAYGRELLGDVKGAYLDFSKAAELKPGWDLPQKELARFTVHRGQDGS